MTLSEKYGIPQSAVKAMMKDGWISCSVAKYEEVYIYYREKKKTVSHSEAIKQTSLTYNISDRWVYEVIKRFE
jgi:hypothetical protein